MKFKVISGAALALALSLAVPIASASAAMLTFSDYGPNRGSRAKALEWFAGKIKDESGGKLDLQFFWGGSLLGGKATLQGLGDGAADMGTVIGFFSPARLRGYNIGDLPVDNSDVWVGMSALNALARNNAALKAEFDAAGVHYVSTYSTTPIQLVCRTKVTSLDELKGLKIRASGPYGKALASLGAEIVSMGQPDVYQALDSGLVDCNQNYYYAIRSYKQYEVAPYVLELDWGQNMAFGIFMSKASYDRLDEADKAVIDKVGDSFIDHFAEVQIADLATNKKAMIDGIDGKKLTVIHLSDSDREKLLAAGRKQIDAWVGASTEAGLDAASVLADYEALIATYAAELKEKGYPWKR